MALNDQKPSKSTKNPQADPFFYRLLEVYSDFQYEIPTKNGRFFHFPGGYPGFFSKSGKKRQNRPLFDPKIPQIPVPQAILMKNRQKSAKNDHF